MRAAGRTLTLGELLAEVPDPTGCATSVYADDRGSLCPIASAEVTPLGLVLRLGPAQPTMGALPGVGPV